MSFAQSVASFSFHFISISLILFGRFFVFVRILLSPHSFRCHIHKSMNSICDLINHSECHFVWHCTIYHSISTPEIFYNKMSFHLCLCDWVCVSVSVSVYVLFDWRCRSRSENRTVRSVTILTTLSNLVWLSPEMDTKTHHSHTQNKVWTLSQPNEERNSLVDSYFCYESKRTQENDEQKKNEIEKWLWIWLKRQRKGRHQDEARGKILAELVIVVSIDTKFRFISNGKKFKRVTESSEKGIFLIYCQSCALSAFIFEMLELRGAFNDSISFILRLVFSARVYVFFFSVAFIRSLFICSG